MEIITQLPTSKQMSQGRTVGIANNENCYTCRKHLTEKGDVVCRQTIFCYSTCKMIICKEIQKHVRIGLTEDYFDEHKTGEDDNTCCSQHVRS